MNTQTPLEDILPGNGASMPGTEPTVVAENQPASTEVIAAGQDATAPIDGHPEGTPADREKRRGSGAQLDARDERHREDIERIRREERAEARRMLAAEIPRQVQAQLQAIQQQQKQPEPPDQFDDFGGAVTHAVRPTINEALTPLQQSMMFNSRLVAKSIHGEKADEAEKAFNEAAAAGQMDPDEWNRINNSPNPFHEAVLWHQQQQRASLIQNPKVSRFLDKASTDPELLDRVDAFLESGGDPQTLTQLGNGGQAQQRPAVMPSNFAAARNVGARTGPAWSGPASIQDIFDRKRAPG